MYSHPVCVCVCVCVCVHACVRACVCHSLHLSPVPQAPPLWQSWWMLSLYCAVVIVVLLGVPLSIKLVVEWCRKMAEEEDLADTQRRGMLVGLTGYAILVALYSEFM